MRYYDTVTVGARYECMIDTTPGSSTDESSLVPGSLRELRPRSWETGGLVVGGGSSLGSSLECEVGKEEALIDLDCRILKKEVRESREDTALSPTRPP